MKKRFVITVLFLSIVTLLLGSGITSAQTPTPTPGLAKVEGKITSVDAQTGRVTVAPAGRPAVTLTVTASTKIEVWGKEPATIQDLRVEQSVEASYNLVTLEAVKIEAKQPGEAAYGFRYGYGYGYGPIQGAKQGFFGTVIAVSANSITIDTKRENVVFTVNPDTQYWNPPNKDANLGDIKVGDRVAVLAAKTDSGLLARRVLVIPSKPTHEQIRGVVTKISGTEITITYDSGKTVVADAPPGLARKIELGDHVTAVILRTPGVEKVLLKDIENSDELIDRLNRIAAKKTDKDKDEVDRLVERNRQKQEEALQRVLDKAPDEAKAGVEKALERSKAKGRGTEVQGKPTAVPATPTTKPGIESREKPRGKQ